MHAFVIEKAGSKPTLRDLPVPLPGPGQVRIRVAACALNFADLLMIDGRYQDTPPAPFTMGMEVAGHVDAIGPDVTGIAIGTLVAAMPGNGGLAEYACLPAEECLPVPAGVPPTIAAAAQIAYATSHLALDRRARLQPGETLLVLGAAGGVGLTAVEIGARMGARVIASARGPERLAIAKAAGAEILIDSEEPGLKDRLKEMGGVDVVYDPVGGPAFLEALRATKPEGRLLTIGYAGGEIPQIPANLLLVKNISVIGLYVGGYRHFNPAASRHSLTTIFDWIVEGSLKPHVSHILPLEQVEQGLDLLRSRAATGKVVISLQP